jgi:GAF domain-containing protein
MPADDVLFEVLTSFAETLADRFDVADVLYALTDHTVDVLGATAAGVSLTDDDRNLQFVSANSETAAELERVQQESHQGPCHQAFTTGVATVVDDISAHSEWPIYRSKAAELGLRSVIGIPLVVGERRLGALNVYNREQRTWSPADVASARILANMATSYVLHASQLDEATRLNEQLQQALDSRIIIEQAKGVLAGDYGIGVEASFEIMRTHARSNNATLRSVAEAIVKLGLRPQVQ